MNIKNIVLEDCGGMGMGDRMPSELIAEVVAQFLAEEGKAPEVEGFCSQEEFNKAFQLTAKSFDWDAAFEKGLDRVEPEFVEHVQKNLQVELLKIIAERS